MQVVKCLMALRGIPLDMWRWLGDFENKYPSAYMYQKLNLMDTNTTETFSCTFSQLLKSMLKLEKRKRSCIHVDTKGFRKFTWPYQIAHPPSSKVRWFTLKVTKILVKYRDLLKNLRQGKPLEDNPPLSPSEVYLDYW